MEERVYQEGQRWATVTPDDKSAVIYIATFLAFTYSSITLLVRCLIKWRIFGYDDWVILVAKATGLIQFGLLLASLKAGLGRRFETLDGNAYTTMAAYLYGNQIALYFALGLSKLATILLVRRLFTREMRGAWLAINILCGVFAAWTILASILVSAGCTPSGLFPRLASQLCHGIQPRYQFVAITDALTDLALVIVPTVLCWHLQMPIKMKIQILVVFSFRLPVIVLAGLFLKSWTASLSATNPGVARYPSIVYQQSQFCLSIIAATMPCLKSWLQSFDTGSGVKANINTSSNGGGSATRSHNRTGGHASGIHLSTLKRNDLSRHDTSQCDEIDPEWRERMKSRTFASSMGTSPPTTTSDAWSERDPRNSHGSESVLVGPSALP